MALIRDTIADVTALDNPVWHALAGHQDRFALTVGRARRYDPEVALFCGLPDEPTPDDWTDLAALLGDAPATFFAASGPPLPPTWEQAAAFPTVRMVATRTIGTPDPTIARLGTTDTGEMLDLVARTRPGPFLTRTVELGTYLGLRLDGRLVAMAGVRMRIPGYSEISAVCTDPEYRNRGLARRLVCAVAAEIEGRGETPFLHARSDNSSAIALYESIGFELRAEFEVVVARPRGIPAATGLPA